MSITTNVISSQILNFFRANPAVESRLLIPALTNELGKKLHATLSTELEDNIPVYLVVNTDSKEPDEEYRIISAEGLTAKRKGSFILIVQPGLYSHIEESILKTVQIGFDDEWPWVDNHHSLLFDFKLIILPKICELASLYSDETREPFKDVMLSASSSLRDTPDRNEIYFENFVDEILSKRPVDGLSPLESLLYDLKIPSGTTGENTGSSEYTKNIEDVGKIAKGLYQTSRSLLRSDAESDELINVIDRLYDGIGSARHKYNGLLGLQHALHLLSVEEWKSVDLKRLKNLFDVRSRIDSVLDAKFMIDAETQKNALLSADSRSLIINQNLSFSICINLAADLTNLGQDSDQSWLLQISIGQKAIWSEKVTFEEVGNLTRNIEFYVSDDCIFGVRETGKAKKLSVKVLRNNKIISKSPTMSIWIIGDKFNKYAVIQEPFTIIPFQAYDEEKSPTVIQLDSPSHVYITSSDPELSEIVYLDDHVSAEQELDLVKLTSSSVLYNLGDSIDPSESASGRVTLSCKFDADNCIDIELVAEETSQGYFSVEDALLNELILNKHHNLLNIFRGETSETYSKLGDIEDDSSLRVSISKLMESTSYDTKGYLPFCIDSRLDRNQLPQFQDCCWCSESLGILKNQFDGDYSDDVIDLLGRYALARSELIKSSSDRFSSESRRTRHPTYARVPLFIYNDKSTIEERVLNYLEIYREIIAYLLVNLTTASRAEQLVLSSLDCVLLYSDVGVSSDACNYDLSLIGPWHPLITAQRYMRQRALFYIAVNVKTNNNIHKMAGVFRDIRGLTSSFGLTDHTSFSHSLVSGSSDLDWCVARLATRNTSFSNFSDTIKRLFGISISSVSYTSATQINTFITNFMYSNPSERRLEIFIRKGFDSKEVISSVTKLIRTHNNGFADQLTGGVHLYFEDLTEIDDMYDWEDPIICVYQAKNEKECLERNHIDILVVAPAQDYKIQSCMASQFSYVPMGREISSVLTSPLSSLLEGPNNTKMSKLQETPYVNIDTNDDINNAVLGITSTMLKLVGGNGIVVQNDIILPRNLSASWVVLPGGMFDPSVLSDFVNSSNNSENQKVLWEYNVDLASPNSEYFILSEVAEGFDQALQSSRFKDSNKRKLISDLSKVGVAIGGEALRSGTKALGVLGQIAAVRLFDNTSILSPLITNELAVGLIIPVDCFDSVLGTGSNSFVSSNRKSDLLVIQLRLTESGLKISSVSVEAKYTSNLFSDYVSAMDQAKQSVNRFKVLVSGANQTHGLIERQVLTKLLKYGLQLKHETSDDLAPSRNVQILDKVLSGQVSYVSPKYEVILCSTEIGLANSNWAEKDEGLWIRLSPNQWPGENEDSNELQEIRNKMSSLFTSLEFEAQGRKGVDVVEPDPIIIPQIEPEPPPNRTNAPTESAAEKNEHEGVEPLVGKNNDQTDSINFLLGFEKNASRRINYKLINESGRSLDNANIMITGSSGKGKTALLKNIINNYRRSDVSTLVFDFKNDFGGFDADNVVFQKITGLSNLDVSTRGMPYNPLKPPLTSLEGERFYRIRNFINETVGAIDEFFKLGPQQKYNLAEAIESAYQDNGVQVKPNLEYRDDITWPTMDEVGVYLKREDKNAFRRLSELFQLGIYSDQFRNVSVSELLKESYVIGLEEGLSDDTRNTVALMAIYNIHKYLNSQPHTSATRYAIVIDESHRVIRSKTIVSLSRECRAYGVSLVLSSQNPLDFPLEVSSSLSTKIIHGNGTDRKNIQAIKGLLNLPASTDETLAQLQKFEAYVANAHYPPVIIDTFTFPLSQILMAVRASDSGVSLDQLKNTEGLWPEQCEFLANELCKRNMIKFDDGLYVAN